MAKFSINRQNVTVTNGNDILTIVAATGRRIKLLRCAITANGTASGTQNIVQVARAGTAGVTPGGAITAQGLYADSTAASTVNTTWGTQPVVPANAGFAYNLSSNGAIRTEAWLPEDAIEARPAENISIRSISGSTPITVDLEFDEQ
jgi:hypothetical protein